MLELGPSHNCDVEIFITAFGSRSKTFWKIATTYENELLIPKYSKSMDNSHEFFYYIIIDQTHIILTIMRYRWNMKDSDDIYKKKLNPLDIH